MNEFTYSGVAWKVDEFYKALEQIDTSTTAGNGLIDAARAALPFIAYAFDQGIDGAEEAGRAIEEALRDDQLQGYVLVPVEPTEAMLEAGGDVEQIHIEWGVDPYVENTSEVWRAMLAARPIRADLAGEKG